MLTGMRRLTAAAATSMGVLAAVVVLGTPAAPRAAADTQCAGQHGSNPENVEYYRKQYSSTVLEPLKRDLAAYYSAAASGGPDEIGRAANALYNEIETDLMMVDDQHWFGCYDLAVLARLQQSADAFVPTLDDISSAATHFSGKTPEDVPALVAQARPLQRAFIDALNAYAGQFGGDQIAKP